MRGGQPPTTPASTPASVPMIALTAVSWASILAMVVWLAYYMTREQSEEAVNYHGFDIANPAVPQNNAAVQRSYRPPKHGQHLE
jgi:hypothetical protein